MPLLVNCTKENMITVNNTTDDMITIVRLLGLCQYRTVTNKLKAIFRDSVMNIMIAYDDDDRCVRFYTYPGISENERFAMEGVIRGLITLFGEE